MERWRSVIKPLEAFAEKLSKDTLRLSWKMVWVNFSSMTMPTSPGEWFMLGLMKLDDLVINTVEKAMIEEWYMVQDNHVP